MCAAQSSPSRRRGGALRLTTGKRAEHASVPGPVSEIPISRGGGRSVRRWGARAAMAEGARTAITTLAASSDRVDGAIRAAAGLLVLDAAGARLLDASGRAVRLAPLLADADGRLRDGGLAAQLRALSERLPPAGQLRLERLRLGDRIAPPVTCTCLRAEHHDSGPCSCSPCRAGRARKSRLLSERSRPSSPQPRRCPRLRARACASFGAATPRGGCSKPPRSSPIGSAAAWSAGPGPSCSGAAWRTSRPLGRGAGRAGDVPRRPRALADRWRAPESRRRALRHPAADPDAAFAGFDGFGLIEGGAPAEPVPVEPEEPSLAVTTEPPAADAAAATDPSSSARGRRPSRLRLLRGRRDGRADRDHGGTVRIRLARVGAGARCSSGCPGPRTRPRPLRLHRGRRPPDPAPLAAATATALTKVPDASEPEAPAAPEPVDEPAGDDSQLSLSEHHAFREIARRAGRALRRRRARRRRIRSPSRCPAGLRHHAAPARSPGAGGGRGRPGRGVLLGRGPRRGRGGHPPRARQPADRHPGPPRRDAALRQPRLAGSPRLPRRAELPRPAASPASSGARRPAAGAARCGGGGRLDQDRGDGARRGPGHDGALGPRSRRIDAGAAPARRRPGAARRRPRDGTRRGPRPPEGTRRDPRRLRRRGGHRRRAAAPDLAQRQSRVAVRLRRPRGGGRADGAARRGGEPSGPARARRGRPGGRAGGGASPGAVGGARPCRSRPGSRACPPIRRGPGRFLLRRT